MSRPIYDAVKFNSLLSLIMHSFFLVMWAYSFHVSSVTLLSAAMNSNAPFLELVDVHRSGFRPAIER